MRRPHWATHQCYRKALQGPRELGVHARIRRLHQRSRNIDLSPVYRLLECRQVVEEPDVEAQPRTSFERCEVLAEISTQGSSALAHGERRGLDGAEGDSHQRRRL